MDQSQPNTFQPYSVWLHAAEMQDIPPLEYLASRIHHTDPSIPVLLSSSHFEKHNKTLNTSVRIVAAPKDTHLAVQQFIAKYKPAYLVWTGAQLKSNLLRTLTSHSAKVTLVNARESDFKQHPLRIFPNTKKRALKYFEKIYAIDDIARTQLIRSGAPADRIFVKGELQEASVLSNAQHALHERFSQACQGRPLWLAACIGEQELAIILRAQEAVLKRDHRNLLVILPHETMNKDRISALLSNIPVRVDFEQDAKSPCDDTQIFIAQPSDALEMWYSIAPVVFLGQSLGGEQGGLDPYVPASHGCALVYGPRVSEFLPRYSRLAKSGAARIVTDADSLAAAVSQIITPSTAAKMTYNAWDALTQGARLTDELAEDIVTHVENLEFDT